MYTRDTGHPEYSRRILFETWFPLMTSIDSTTNGANINMHEVVEKRFELQNNKQKKPYVHIVRTHEHAKTTAVPERRQVGIGCVARFHELESHEVCDGKYK